MKSDFYAPAIRMLTVRQVQSVSSLSRATIYRFMDQGRFPKPIKLTPNGRVGWRRGEIDAWLENPLSWTCAPADGEKDNG